MRPSCAVISRLCNASPAGRACLTSKTFASLPLAIVVSDVEPASSDRRSCKVADLLNFFTANRRHFTEKTNFSQTRRRPISIINFCEANQQCIGLQVGLLKTEIAQKITSYCNIVVDNVTRPKSM